MSKKKHDETVEVTVDDFKHHKGGKKLSRKHGKRGRRHGRR